MNKLLLCAYHLRKLKPANGFLELHIVTDYLPRDCHRMLAPWSPWLRILTCQKAHPEIRAGQIAIAIGGDTEVTGARFVIGGDTKALKQKCEDVGAMCLIPDLGELGTIDNDLLREVSFFDFELSGKNVWDGAKTCYSNEFLAFLSSTHCRDAFPAWAFTNLSQHRRPLKVMDIGCGPRSILRWGAIQGDLSITGVDPILDMYTLILARHGFDLMEKMRCDHEITGFAEDLDTLVPDNDYDVVYTRNALDHTQDPTRVVECVSRRLAPHGRFAITVAEREGTRQGWDQLHKTDIYLEIDTLMYTHQHSSPKLLLTMKSGLRLKEARLEADWLYCIAVK
jgi:SAM-dependent methyltransferase